MQKFYTLICTLVLLLSMTFMAPVSALAADYTPVVTENEISVFLETSYDNAKIWVWNDKVKQFTTAAWPGDAMTLMGTKDGKKVFKWTYTGGTEIPTGRLFKIRIKIWYKKWCYIGVFKLLIFNTLIYKIVL